MTVMIDTQWTYDRIRLYKLWKNHADWSQKRFADVIGYSVSWVKKWLARFRQVDHLTLEVFASRSRAPHNPAHKVSSRIREVILNLRQNLPEQYGRVVGAKPILYHLHHNGYFKDVSLPTSSATIWRVLKDAGYIPQKVKYHIPLDPSPP